MRRLETVSIAEAEVVFVVVRDYIVRRVAIIVDAVADLRSGWIDCSIPVVAIAAISEGALCTVPIGIRINAVGQVVAVEVVQTVREQAVAIVIDVVTHFGGTRVNC